MSADRDGACSKALSVSGPDPAILARAHHAEAGTPFRPELRLPYLVRVTQYCHEQRVALERFHLDAIETKAHTWPIQFRKPDEARLHLPTPLDLNDPSILCLVERVTNISIWGYAASLMSKAPWVRRFGASACRAMLSDAVSLRAPSPMHHSSVSQDFKLNTGLQSIGYRDRTIGVSVPTLNFAVSLFFVGEAVSEA
jgi:hypothetical protein